MLESVVMYGVLQYGVVEFAGCGGLRSPIIFAWHRQSWMHEGEQAWDGVLLDYSILALLASLLVVGLQGSLSCIRAA